MRMELLRGEGDGRVLRVSALLPDGSPSVVDVFGPRGWRDHTVGVRGPGGRRWAEPAGGAAARADRRGRAARERGPVRNPLRGDVARELTVRPVRRIDEFLERVLRPAEAACSAAVDLAAPFRAVTAAGVPE